MESSPVAKPTGIPYQTADLLIRFHGDGCTYFDSEYRSGQLTHNFEINGIPYRVSGYVSAEKAWKLSASRVDCFSVNLNDLTAAACRKFEKNILPALREWVNTHGKDLITEGEMIHNRNERERIQSEIDDLSKKIKELEDQISNLS